MGSTMTGGQIAAHILLLVAVAHTTQGLGPAYGGDQFLRLKSVPPAEVAGRVSGSLTLTCSVTGSPTPVVGWYKQGKVLAGTQASPGGLGETWAKLHLPCLSQADVGEYECKGEAGGRRVHVDTKVSIVGHSPHSGCQTKDKLGGSPTITGWQSTVMMQSGETARLACNVQDTSEKHSVVWRNAAGEVVTEEGRYKIVGTDLVIDQASWADMGRFTCSVQNGFGVDMVSSFLYPLAPAFYDYSQ